MTPVFQTKFPPKHPAGNCLAAVVASLLDLTIEEVPNFEVFTEGTFWRQALTEFFHQHGYFVQPHFPLLEHYVWDKPFPKGMNNVLYVCYGEVLGVSHVIIKANNKLVHDPTRFGAGLDKVTDVWVFRKRIDPAKNAGLAEGALLAPDEITYSKVPQVPDYDES